MKVLATAYACEPGLGSEAGIGWNWTRQIARRHELVLITRENNVEAIERAAAAEGLDLTVVGHDLPYWMRFWKRKSRGAVAYFYLWQRSLAKVAQRLDTQHDFDLVQHLTFASSWVPSGLAATGKPFVWGPVGQHPRVPDEYLKDARSRRSEHLKALVRRTLLRFDGALRRTLHGADVILSLGREFGDQVPLQYRHKVMPMLACGTVERAPELGAVKPRTRARGEPLEVLFSGRLIDLKGPGLAMAAFAQLRAEVPARMTFLGDGPRRADLEQQARELGITDDVELTGNLPHAEALERMHAAHVFLFPSFEGAGMVVPEAMIAGNPVVCLDFGGPGDMTGAERGIAVPLGATVAETVANLADALLTLGHDEGRRLELAQNALRWARSETTWEAKGERLAEIYARALGDELAARTEEAA